eukprot:2875375-Pyramimonas_sp.AAC.1
MEVPFNFADPRHGMIRWVFGVLGGAESAHPLLLYLTGVLLGGGGSDHTRSVVVQPPTPPTQCLL